NPTVMYFGKGAVAAGCDTNTVKLINGGSTPSQCFAWFKKFFHLPWAMKSPLLFRGQPLGDTSKNWMNSMLMFPNATSNASRKSVFHPWKKRFLTKSWRFIVKTITSGAVKASA
ncbi:MAG: hypothetical protein CMO41_07525, partial [Verrucomicrobiales bacterium]|nr:hypothetical protein [Verrucomicrobiales bacterium]